MEKTIFIILSHCNNDKKIRVLKETIKSIKDLALGDICLTSHIPLSEEILQSVDYFSYDKSNPILSWPERAFYHWKDFSLDEKRKVKLIYLQKDYGWTPFNQMINGYSMIRKKEYEKVIFVNYDILIDEEFIKECQNSTITTSYHVKDQYGLLSYPSLIFSIFTKYDAEKLVDILDKEVYIDSEYAEKYFEKLLSVFFAKKSDYVSQDRIDYSDGTNGNLFDNSTSKNFSYFYSNFEFAEDVNTYKYFFYDVKAPIVIKVNDEILTIDKNYYIETNSDVFVKYDETFTNITTNQSQSLQNIKLL